MFEQLTSEPTLRYVMIGFAVLCALMGFMRGIGRLLLLGLALAAGAAAALACLRYLPGLSISWFNKNPPQFIQWTAIAVGLVVAWFARRFLNALVSGEAAPIFTTCISGALASAVLSAAGGALSPHAVRANAIAATITADVADLINWLRFMYAPSITCCLSSKNDYRRRIPGCQRAYQCRYPCG